MEVKAKLKYLKSSPRKTRLVIDIIRGMKVDDALDQLENINKKVAEAVKKLLNSAVSNAVNNFELEKDNLFIKEIKADDGPTLKRWMPRARGRATPLRKRTAHLTLVLGELVSSGKKEAKKQKIDAPVKLDEKIAQASGRGEKVEAEEKKMKKDQDLTVKINDPRGEGRGKNTKIEGKSNKGFMGKIFRRKSG